MMDNSYRKKYKNIGDYVVYNDGRVFSIKRGKFLTPVMGKGKSKYLVVKVPHRIKLHRLVAECFKPNPHNKKFVNHKNGIKTDNKSSNLEWCTFEENMHHSHSTGLHNNKGENSGRAKLKSIDVGIIREALQNGFNDKQIAGYFNVSSDAIWCIKNGQTWKSV